MAKRYTDTEKWKKQFLKRLSSKHKLFWQFINDDCDHSGVWYVDIEVASIRVGEKIDLPEALKAFNEDETRIVEIDNGKKWLILPFIPFQYGEVLSEKNRLHTSVSESLRKHGFEYAKGLIRALYGPKVKVKDKVKVIGEEHEKGEILIADRDEVLEADPNYNQLESFNVFFEAYPSKIKRSQALRIWVETVVNRDIASRIQKALVNYKMHLDANSWKQPQEPQNWLAEWPDWEHYQPEDDHANRSKSGLEKLRELREKRVS